jgi:hypothetical protein
VRKDGNQSKPAPVWFTLSADREQLLIQAHKGSWKDKRIRRGSPVIAWIGGLKDRSFVGKAEITKDASVVDKILTDYPKKYTMNALLGPSRENFESGDVWRIFSLIASVSSGVHVVTYQNLIPTHADAKGHPDGSRRR